LDALIATTPVVDDEPPDPLLDDPVAWITTNFYIPEINAPIELYPSQEIPLREALRRDAAGNFIYSTIMWSMIKKSAKSSLTAAVGLWFAFRKPNSSIKVLGNDLKQAQSRVYEYMRRAILLRDDWRHSVKINNYKLIFPNGSVVEAIPVDPQGEAGGNDDLVIVTELWGWKSAKHQQMWTETTVPPTKYGQALRWGESYAGYQGESPVLEQLYENGVTEGECINAEHEMYRNKRLFVLWNTRPTLPWQTDDYYDDQRTQLLPVEFDRVHGNKWATARSAFVPPNWWEDCEDKAGCIGARNPVIIALDAAVSGDCFAVVTVTRQSGKIFVKDCHIWTPPPGGKLDYADVERYLRDLKARYSVREFAYDPYQLHDMATRLYGKLGFWRPFPQGQDRLIADKRLYDLIRDEQIAHDGDPALAEHIRNASAAPDGDKLRIVKRAEQQKIDAAVALSMACDRAIYYRIGGA
jgi:phage terminase large subunit-like protein